MRQELLGDIALGDSPGHRKMESDTEPPEVDISMVEDHGDPEPYQFEPLVPASVLPEAGALRAEAITNINVDGS